MSDTLSPETDPNEVGVAQPGTDPKDEIFPPTRGHIRYLIDGVDAFREMQKAILGAERYIYLSVWYIQLTTVLRGKEGAKTIATLLQRAAAKAKVRVLVSFLDNQEIVVGKVKFKMFPQANSAASLARRLNALDKNITALVAVHPYSRTIKKLTLRPGCGHEKLMIVDGRSVFCGGLEFDELYTDSTSKHDHSNRHDVHSLITGPVVKHFEQHFVTRWRAAKKRHDDQLQKESTNSKGKVTKSARKQEIPDLPDASQNYDADARDHAIQVAITKSDDGSINPTVVVTGILEAYKQAIAEAKSYIYMENQYFRDQDLTNAIAKRLNQNASLQVILVLPLKAEEKENPFSLHAEFVQHRTLEALKSVDPRRVGIYSVVRRASKGGDIYTHGKIMIVDDRWFTIGSANANPRSFRLDDEINIIVRNDEQARELRLKLWCEHFQADASLQTKFDISQSKSFVDTWTTIGKKNDQRVRTGKALRSRVVTHREPAGKEFDLKSLGLSWFQEQVLPNLDQFVWDLTETQQEALA